MTMNFEIGDMDFAVYQRMLAESNYKSIFRTPQFLNVWREGIRGTEIKFLISENAVIPGVIFKRGPLRAFYSLPYQTFGGVVGETGAVKFNFRRFSEVAIDDPEMKTKIPGLKPTESTEAVIDLTEGYERIFSNYSPSRRKILRKFKEVDVQEIKSTGDIETIYPLYRNFCEEKKIHCFPERFFHALFNNLLPEHLYGFIVFMKGSAAGYIINVRGFGKTTAFSHAWNRYFKNISSFLMDISIKEAIRLGDVEFSLGLTDPGLSGVYEFKRSFGAEFRKMRTYWKRTFYHNLARNIKTGVKKWIRF